MAEKKTASEGASDIRPAIKTLCTRRMTYIEACARHNLYLIEKSGETLRAEEFRATFIRERDRNMILQRYQFVGHFLLLFVLIESGRPLSFLGLEFGDTNLVAPYLLIALIGLGIVGKLWANQLMIQQKMLCLYGDASESISRKREIVWFGRIDISALIINGSGKYKYYSYGIAALVGKIYNAIFAIFLISIYLSLLLVWIFVIHELSSKESPFFIPVWVLVYIYIFQIIMDIIYMFTSDTLKFKFLDKDRYSAFLADCMILGEARAVELFRRREGLPKQL